ncbi:MAG: type IV secretory system conjugative DNA transfer family protein [Treponema sp.]|jgi:type IV secretion system protein VirD4|nr:type IV secretory system conjugative DNA transfer family protein [Treponema sp.]
MFTKKNQDGPSKPRRNPAFVLANYLVPILIVLAGIFISTQSFASRLLYNPAYTSAPLFVTKTAFFMFPSGYPIFNPLLIYLYILSHPFDKAINAVLLNALFPLFVSIPAAFVMYFVLAFIRGYKKNRNDHLFGDARWADERDLKEYGLAQETGVVLAQFYRAKLGFNINPKNNSISLTLKKNAPLVCHGGGTNTLMIAPTRSGKGVGSVIPTCLNYPSSMIVFDPKGELFQATSGFRKKFSRILKFSPISRHTACFNPLEEVDLSGHNTVSDVGLILTNMFEEGKGGEDGTTAFFNSMAKDLLTGVILHVLLSKLYPDEEKNLAGILSILSRTSAEKKTNGQGQEEGAAGGALFHEMIGAKHYSKDGAEHSALHRIVEDSASRLLGTHAKVRSDIFTTVFSKMQLFQDPNIAYCTGFSDFSLQDFYDTKEPVTLYLTVPFSDIDRIKPVFKLLINFILNKFSRGEAMYGEVKLPFPILFMIDEFPILGAFPFLSKTLGILAGYGITFYIIVQALNQIADLYGQNHTFLDNCKTVCLYAPGKIEDAKVFSEMIGKKSVIKDSTSVSGSRFTVQLNNISESSQEMGKELMNASQLMKLPPTEALIFNQGMPAYRAKKVVYFMDGRFKRKAYSVKPVARERLFDTKVTPQGFILQMNKQDILLDEKSIQIIEQRDGRTLVKYTELAAKTGFPPPATRSKLEQEIRGLPSYRLRQEARKQSAELKRKEETELNVKVEDMKQAAQDETGEFDALAFIMSYQDGPSLTPVDSGLGA